MNNNRDTSPRIISYCIFIVEVLCCILGTIILFESKITKLYVCDGYPQYAVLLTIIVAYSKIADLIFMTFVGIKSYVYFYLHIWGRIFLYLICLYWQSYIIIMHHDWNHNCIKMISSTIWEFIIINAILNFISLSAIYILVAFILTTRR